MAPAGSSRGRGDGLGCGAQELPALREQLLAELRAEGVDVDAAAAVADARNILARSRALTASHALACKYSRICCS